MYAPVSVVIPCFRCSDTIDRAVESVFNQRLRPQEVILVEDCSGDKTLEKLYEVKERYPDGWIKVIALDINSGPGTARNKGWEMAQQEYVAFLDADDSWHPKKIEVQYGWMRSNPSSMITGHKCQVVSFSTNFEEGEVDGVRSDDIKAQRVTLFSLLLRNKFQTPSVMVRRSVGVRMVEGKRYSEDYYTWLKIIYSEGEAHYLDYPLAFLHKSAYGEGGLSGSLWSLEKGELDTYIRCYKDGAINGLVLVFLLCFSYLKYLRRVGVVFLRKAAIKWVS